MTDIGTILIIAGAAEGSYYRVPHQSCDVRYVPSFALKSGLSFGIFQLDVHANSTARLVFREILQFGVADGTIDQDRADSLGGLAAHANAGIAMKSDVSLLTTLMGTSVVRHK
jgi:hypothetical protein